jgi:hypothetical protein
MYTIPHSSMRRSLVAAALGQVLLIVLYRAAVWQGMEETWWYLDRFLLYPVLFTFQWAMLSHRPPLIQWLKWGEIALLAATVIIWTLGASVILFIKHLFLPVPPNIWIAREYYLLEDLIYNMVLGGAIGWVQADVLNQVSSQYRWWIWMTLLAYGINAVWWYLTKTWPPGM